MCVGPVATDVEESVGEAEREYLFMSQSASMTSLHSIHECASLLLQLHTPKLSHLVLCRLVWFVPLAQM
jgi:hypothetical protein